MDGNQLWYKNAVFYEVYVRAYKDSNGDGHGDLNGLTQKLDYLHDLGVDCLWLLPIYPSPLKDDGYDIADYYHVLETYGALEDFKALVDTAHQNYAVLHRDAEQGDETNGGRHRQVLPGDQQPDYAAD